MHFIIASSALHRHFVAVIFQNLHPFVVAVFPLAVLTFARPTRFFPSLLSGRLISLLYAQTPSRMSETSPNPN